MWKQTVPLFFLFIRTFSSETCDSDSDCKSLSPTFDTPLSNTGGYLCIKSQCRFVVKAGELCQVSDDCAAFQYLTRGNTSVSSNVASLCSPDFCTLESNCDTAWVLEGKLPQPGTQKCCGGIVQNNICPLEGLHNMDICETGTTCSSSSSGGVCETQEQHYQTWIGVVLVLLGGCLLNVGLNLQKFALNRYEARKNLTQLQAQVTQDLSLPSSNSAVLASGPGNTDPPQMSENPTCNSQGETFTQLQPDPRSFSQNPEVSTVDAPSSKVRRDSTILSQETRVVAHSTRDKLSMLVSRWRTSVLSPLWLLGLIIYIGASGLNFVALQFAPQSLVGPLGSISLITNVILAPLINKERLGKSDFLGIALIIGGCVLVVFFSGIVQPDYRLCVLFALFSRTQTIILLVIIVGLLVIIFMYIKIVEKNILPLTEQSPIRNMVQDPNLSSNNVCNHLKDQPSNSLAKKSQLKPRKCQLFALDSSIFDPIIPTLRNPVSRKSFHFRFILPISYAAMGSLMATLTTLFAKTLVNLLSVSIFKHNNQFNSWLPWIILLTVAFTAFSQVYWITLGLRRYDALLQVPVFYVIWTLFDIIGGGIYYNEFSGFTPLKYGMFCLGVAIIFTGVLVLARRMSAIN